MLKHTYTRQKTEHKHALSEMLHKQTWKFANREDISRASTIELYFHKFEGNTKLWRYPRSLSFFSGNDLLLSTYARNSHKGTKLILVHNIASVSYSHPRVETFWNKELHQHRLQLHHVCSPTAYTKHHSHMRYIYHLIIIYITTESILLTLGQKCSRLHNPLAGVPYPILKGLSPQSALFCCFYIVSIVIYVYIEGNIKSNLSPQ